MGGPTYMKCIFEEKMKIEGKMVDREAGSSDAGCTRV